MHTMSTEQCVFRTYVHLQQEVWSRQQAVDGKQN